MPTHPARSRRRRIDVRLAIGVMLVVVSVLGVWGLVRSLDRTVDVYTAPSTLVLGDTVRASQLGHQAVRLGDAGGRYATVGSLPEGSLTVSRELEQGELVPQSAVTSDHERTHTRVVLSVPGPVSDLVRGGARIDVWAARPTEQNGFEAPEPLADGVLVVRQIDAEGFMANEDQVSLEVQVDKDTAGRLIESMVRGDALTTVPTVLADGDQTAVDDRGGSAASDSDEGEGSGATDTGQEQSQ